MIYKNLSDVIKFVANEIIQNRKVEISFCVSSAQLITSDFLSQVISIQPQILMCVSNVSYQVLNLGLALEYKLVVEYTDVMPACVEYVQNVQDLKKAVHSSTLLHRREVFLVFKKQKSEEFLDYIREFTKLPEMLSCYLQSVRVEIKKIQECSYCGLQLQLTYTCSYREFRVREAEMNEAIIDILHEVKRAGIEDWKKAYAVVNYCVKNWEYGTSPDYPEIEFTAYGAIVKKRAVCMGISLAVCIILRKLGIPCRYIQGKRNGEGHAWNMVFLNGGWFYIDVTDAIGAKNPLYHWGVTEFDDSRTTSKIQLETLNCRCPVDFIRKRFRD